MSAIVRVIVVGMLIAGVGCAGRRDCVPTPIANVRELTDLSARPDAHAPVSKGLTEKVEAAVRRETAGRHPPGTRPYQFLALSGGGLYGAFGIGVLTGWTESGTRPEFDVVTGISTGGLIATYAFLGPEYDPVLREALVGLESRDILCRRRIPFLPFASSLFLAKPVRKRIEKYVTPELLAEVARAHAAGRRLYIGTTNLDTRQLIMWDMGAIASRGTPEALALYRAVLLATGAVPGAFPPVLLPVEIDGQRYEELHVDGGASDEVIFRAFMVSDLNRRAGRPGPYAPDGSRLYIVSNGKLYADPDCVKPRVPSLLGASFRSLVYGKTRDELYRIYFNCLQTNVDMRIIGIPQDLIVGKEGSLQLSPEDQWKLFAVGRGLGFRAPDGPQWRKHPPGTDPSEQALPRSGTRFVTQPNAAPGIGCSTLPAVAPAGP